MTRCTPPRAAAEEGVVPGGGVVYLRSIEAVEKARGRASGDQKMGFDIIIKALRAPARQIINNTGEDGDVIVEQILEKKGSQGYNARTREFVDMIQAGVLDPREGFARGVGKRGERGRSDAHDRSAGHRAEG